MARAMRLAVLLALAFSAISGRATEPEAWRAHADIIFRPIQQTADQPAMVLPTNMEQDAEGFLWAGGETGLLRWDGYRFAVYTASRNPPDGLPHHGIAALHRDKAGRLWVGTLGGNLARYDVATDSFVTVPLGEDSSAVQCVWSIDDDGDGGLWVATKDGIFEIDAEGRMLRHLRHDPAQPGSLPDDHIQAVLRDNRGIVWAGGRNGLAWSDPQHGDLRFHDMPLPTNAGDRAEVSRLLQDSMGRVWAGTRQQGAYVILPGAAGATRLAATAGNGSEAPVEITSMAEVAPGQIWLGTFGRGIVAVEGAGLQIRLIRHDPRVPGTLGSNSIFSIYTDPSGLTWVGTTVGLSLYNPGSFGIFTLFSREPGPLQAATPLDGITGFDITAILARPDGGLWAASEAGGVDILDAAGRNVANLPLQRVFCLADAGSQFLAGTRDGLYLANPVSRHVTRLTLPGRRATAGVFSLHRSQAGTGTVPTAGIIWLGGSDDGLWAFRLGVGGRPQVIQHVDAPALTSSVVHAIAEAPGGKLAAGTDNGFNLVDPATGAVERILHDPGDPSSIGVGGVESFALDKQGRLWAGTDTSGISVMIGRSPRGTPRFRHIGIAEGLPNTDINAMLPDDRGRIWLSTDHGLAVVDPADFSVRALTQADGAAILAYWTNSAARTARGTLVFGGTGGLTFVRPDEVKSWSYRPPIRITDIRLAGRPVRPLSDDPGETLPWLLVPPDVNALSAEFAALDFSAPERNRYRYRLLGFNADWSVTDAAHRVAAYTNLPPGDYTLQIEGSNRDGLWTGHAASLPIRVRPSWYQTLWFHIAEALAAGAAVSCVVQARTVVLRRRQRELERLVDERTDELRASQRRLHALAYLDSLTGLPNRRAFNEHMDRSIEGAAQRPVVLALVLIDLDGFKQVNDTLGHDAGDEVLVVAATRLSEAVREGDFVARLGGDEFSIVLHGTTDIQSLDTICSRVVTGMTVPLMLTHGPARIGASLGVALFPQHGTTLDELYKRADLALYAAKRAGKGNWRWYEETAA